MGDISRTALWAGVLASAASLSAVLALLGLRIDLSHAVLQVSLALTGIGAALIRPRLRNTRETRLADLAECWGLLTLISTIGALTSYVVMLRTVGYADPWLAAVDRGLGFDWVGAYRYIAERPLLARLSELIYLSIFASPILLLSGLALAGRADRARGFIAAFGLSLAFTLLVFPFFPARSALAYHLGTNVAYMPATGISHLAASDALRSGALRVLDIGALSGMITFPSFHAAAAVLFIWAAWPLARLRLPLLALNLAMLVVTPVQGTHFLIDVIAGVAVASAALGLLYLRAGRPRRAALVSRPLRRPPDQAAIFTRSTPVSELA
ncbi:PAP2 family protein [Sphingomonas gei]|uniref:PAP2 family protein n=1 Tax=Sphingomonas gei TaxID=1395960 RepID=A0A4S1XEE2_9SPHN|nr:phosphatase PAP2 family protein [Sphingomonas gei]TGX54924.1 PAP2 family protein [Sphingomonas gei]